MIFIYEILLFSWCDEELLHLITHRAWISNL